MIIDATYSRQCYVLYIVYCDQIKLKIFLIIIIIIIIITLFTHGTISQ